MASSESGVPPLGIVESLINPDLETPFGKLSWGTEQLMAHFLYQDGAMRA